MKHFILTTEDDIKNIALDYAGYIDVLGLVPTEESWKTFWTLNKNKYLKVTKTPNTFNVY